MRLLTLDKIMKCIHRVILTQLEKVTFTLKSNRTVSLWRINIKKIKVSATGNGILLWEIASRMKKLSKLN